MTGRPAVGPRCLRTRCLGDHQFLREVEARTLRIDRLPPRYSPSTTSRINTSRDQLIRGLPNEIDAEVAEADDALGLAEAMGVTQLKSQEPLPPVLLLLD